MTNKAIPKAFVKNVLHNGMGRYICQLQRVTLNFCKSQAGSLGMRDFIEHHLLDFTRANPGVVIYLKPRRHRPAALTAEYLNGRREVLDANNMPVEAVCKWLEHLRTRSGVQIVSMPKLWHTDTPSVQGIWHPLLHKHPQLATTPFPAPELYRRPPQQKSATEMLMEDAGVKKLGGEGGGQE